MMIKYINTLVTVIMVLPFYTVIGQAGEPRQTLSDRQKAIVQIAAFTTKGDLVKLKGALNEGLDGKLTINEAKEVLVHLYAYCGFPRSIQGLNTLMGTLTERKAKGIQDQAGREATPVSYPDKYEAGGKNLARLGGRPSDGPITKPTSGYGAFSPEIDTFLKEHLFADIFGRDVLTFSERELTTISVLTALGSGVEPMLQSHLGHSMTQGLTEAQVNDFFSLFEKAVSKPDAEAGRKVFNEMRAARKSPR